MTLPAKKPGPWKLWLCCPAREMLTKKDLTKFRFKTLKGEVLGWLGRRQRRGVVNKYQDPLNILMHDFKGRAQVKDSKP